VSSGGLGGHGAGPFPAELLVPSRRGPLAAARRSSRGKGQNFARMEQSA
jgi:hypothetical protein